MERKEFKEALAKKRILLLRGEITEEEAVILRAWLQFLNVQSKKKKIKLIIDSQGGEVTAALLLYDAILLSAAPVIGIVNGECSSVAVVVLQAMKKRLATKHSFFYLHPIIIGFGKITLDDIIEEKIKEKLERGRKRQELIHQILKERTGKTLEEVKAKEGKMITAELAKDFGLIDEVIEKYKI